MLTYHFSTSGFQKTNVKLSALTSVVEKPMLTNIIYNYAITFLLASVFYKTDVNIAMLNLHFVVVNLCSHEFHFLCLFLLSLHFMNLVLNPRHELM